MKLACGPTPEDRFEQIKQWHRHFALFPVRVGKEECRWLEWVERRYVVIDEGCWAGGYKAEWQYRTACANG